MNWNRGVRRRAGYCSLARRPPLLVLPFFERRHHRRMHVATVSSHRFHVHSPIPGQDSPTPMFSPRAARTRCREARCFSWTTCSLLHLHHVRPKPIGRRRQRETCRLRSVSPPQNCDDASLLSAIPRKEQNPFGRVFVSRNNRHARVGIPRRALVGEGEVTASFISE